MRINRPLALGAALLIALPLVGCKRAATPAGNNSSAAITFSTGDATIPDATIPVTVQSGNGSHVFNVQIAKTEAQQSRGMMNRTSVADDGGILFAPYPPDGGPPARANFFMKNVSIPLDIVFVRPDHTIAQIAANTVPESQALISSNDVVNAVLEVKGGMTASLGIKPGDKVSWPGQS